MTLTASIMLTPVASASGPSSKQIAPAHPDTLVQDASWLAAKNSYRVVSGVKPSNNGKEGQSHPHILATPLFDVASQKKNPTPYVYPGVPGEPTTAMLYDGYGLEYTAEPSDGWNPNLPNATQYTDDAGSSYNDGYYFTFCGPGAADVAAWYMPFPNNDATYTESDSLPGNGQDGGSHSPGALTWYGQDGSGGSEAWRLRGYMSYLALGMHVPSWHDANNNPIYGMLPWSFNTTGAPGGSTLQSVRDVLNWEDSSENPSTWANYFYTVTWNNSVNNIGVTLHNDIVTDVANSGRAVVVEVNAKDLPNWTTSNNVNHFIAIIGYDDNADQYYYIDTCKLFTHCHNQGGANQGDTPDVHYISEEDLTTAVSAISTTTGTGDGGWVW